MSSRSAGQYEYFDTLINSDNVTWFGSIPPHWEIKKISHIVKMQSGDSIESSEIEPEGEFPVFGGNGLRGYAKNFNLDGRHVLIGRQGALCGNINYSVGKVWASEHAVVVYPLVHVDVDWLGETLRAMDLNQYNVSAAQPGLSITNITCLNLPYPPFVEQQKIANFLDHETAKIDTLIEKQQQLIKLLKEKRQAVISHAVTKGLNPDAPMKDSGVEWLGEVPEGWVVKNIKYAITAIGDVDHYMPNSVDEGIPYLMTGDLKELVSNTNFLNSKKVDAIDYDRLSKKIKTEKGDVIVARYATIGTASYVDIEKKFLVSYSCVTIKPCPLALNGLYLFYYLKSHEFLQGIKTKININTQSNVGVQDLKDIKIPLPKLDEQQKIVEHLELNLRKLDYISWKSVEAVQMLQERRTALISAAVTGKIDVRNWQPPKAPSTPSTDA